MASYFLFGSGTACVDIEQIEDDDSAKEVTGVDEEDSVAKDAGSPPKEAPAPNTSETKSRSQPVIEEPPLESEGIERVYEDEVSCFSAFIDCGGSAAITAGNDDDEIEVMEKAKAVQQKDDEEDKADMSRDKYLIPDEEVDVPTTGATLEPVNEEEEGAPAEIVTTPTTTNSAEIVTTPTTTNTKKVPPPAPKEQEEKQQQVQEQTPPPSPTPDWGPEDPPGVISPTDPPGATKYVSPRASLEPKETRMSYPEDEVEASRRELSLPDIENDAGQTEILGAPAKRARATPSPGLKAVSLSRSPPLPAPAAAKEDDEGTLAVARETEGTDGIPATEAATIKDDLIQHDKDAIERVLTPLPAELHAMIEEKKPEEQEFPEDEQEDTTSPVSSATAEVLKMSDAPVMEEKKEDDDDITAEESPVVDTADSSAITASETVATAAAAAVTVAAAVVASDKDAGDQNTGAPDPSTMEESPAAPDAEKKLSDPAPLSPTSRRIKQETTEDGVELVQTEIPIEESATVAEVPPTETATLPVSEPEKVAPESAGAPSVMAEEATASSLAAQHDEEGIEHPFIPRELTKADVAEKTDVDVPHNGTELPTEADETRLESREADETSHAIAADQVDEEGVIEDFAKSETLEPLVDDPILKSRDEPVKAPPADASEISDETKEAGVEEIVEKIEDHPFDPVMEAREETPVPMSQPDDEEDQVMHVEGEEEASAETTKSTTDQNTVEEFDPIMDQRKEDTDPQSDPNREPPSEDQPAAESSSEPTVSKSNASAAEGDAPMNDSGPSEEVDSKVVESLPPDHDNGEKDEVLEQGIERTLSGTRELSSAINKKDDKPIESPDDEKEADESMEATLKMLSPTTDSTALQTPDGDMEEGIERSLSSTKEVAAAGEPTSEAPAISPTPETKMVEMDTPDLVEDKEVEPSLEKLVAPMPETESNSLPQESMAATDASDGEGIERTFSTVKEHARLTDSVDANERIEELDNKAAPTVTAETESEAQTEGIEHSLSATVKILDQGTEEETSEAEQINPAATVEEEGIERSLSSINGSLKPTEEDERVLTEAPTDEMCAFEGSEEEVDGPSDGKDRGFSPPPAPSEDLLELMKEYHEEDKEVDKLESNASDLLNQKIADSLAQATGSTEETTESERDAILAESEQSDAPNEQKLRSEKANDGNALVEEEGLASEAGICQIQGDGDEDEKEQATQQINEEDLVAQDNTGEHEATEERNVASTKLVASAPGSPEDSKKETDKQLENGESKSSENHSVSVEERKVHIEPVKMVTSADEIGKEEEDAAYRAMLEEEKRKQAAFAVVVPQIDRRTLLNGKYPIREGFPFDSVVVTSPDHVTAEAASNGPLKNIQASLPKDVKIVSTSDPFDTRCGSGGGTLAALDRVEENDNKSVLIVHAGGESSRCPTQMSLGKSFTSLPTKLGIIDPTRRIVSQLGFLFTGLPLGSVVVAASDTLLSLPTEEPIDFSECGDDVVLGLAVPAPNGTAKNHGVYCLEPGDEMIRSVRQFLQKPTPEEMIKEGADFDGNAWIDTGVVIFLPKAADALRKLCRTGAKACTEAGLTSMWRDTLEVRTEGAMDMTTAEFAKENAIKVELYTHFMLALQTTQSEAVEMLESLHDFHERFGNELPPDMLRSIHNALHKFKFKAITFDKGQFLHLGTTREMLDFLVNAASETKATDETIKRYQDFGSELGVIRRLGTYVMPAGEIDRSVVVFNSSLTSSRRIVIEKSTLLEHCVLVVDGDISIGSSCLISGLRGKAPATLRIPSNMCFQSMALQKPMSFVFIYFGVDDNVKTKTKLYGMDLEVVMAATGLEESDLWDESETKKTIWTAKLHPIVNAGTLFFSDFFDWITEVIETGILTTHRTSFITWKASRRMPLNQIRAAVDASKEWASRTELQNTMVPAKESQLLSSVISRFAKRDQKAFDFDYVLQEAEASGSTSMFLALLQTIDRAVLSFYESDILDVSARALSVMYDLLSDALEASVIKKEDIQLESVAVIGKDTDLGFEGGSMQNLGQLIRRLTELVVFGSKASMIKNYPRNTKAGVDSSKWMLSTAPARVDLAGGWSDTPPICYENGGAVFGVAVTVDSLKPLSCRTRKLEGAKGSIRLRCETRNPKNGSLVGDAVEVECHSSEDFADYNIPTAPCALLKCALIYLGVVPNGRKGNLQYLSQVYASVGDENGLEVVASSLLPHGSGMGSSSILSGCVLDSVSKCLSIDMGSDENALIQSVLELEQMLTTGGGWQDQVNGLMGGFKLASCKAFDFPVRTSIERIANSSKLVEGRLVLAFTGKTRLAKNILNQVLRRWSRRTPEIKQKMTQLVEGAYEAYAAVESEDLEDLASCLNRYWELKKAMVGPGSGVEPVTVSLLLSRLHDEGVILGGSLCGAGGGGFLVIVTSEGNSLSDVLAVAGSVRGAIEFSWHSCTVSEEGITSRTVDTSKAEDSSVFDISWHTVGKQDTTHLDA